MPESPSLLLSVCIPAYNNPRGLLELVETTQALALKTGMADRIELCISDDASPDPSGAHEVRKRTWAISVRTDFQPKNLGFSGNLMHTIGMAKGRYLAFAGDDDIFDAERFPALLERLKTDAPALLFRTMADAPLSAQNIADKVILPQSTTTPRLIKDAEEFLREIGFLHATFIGNMVFRRDAFLAHFRERDLQTLYPHYAVLLRVLDTYGAVYIPEQLFYFNGGNNNDWNLSLLASVDLPRLLSEHFSPKRGRRILPAFYSRQLRGLPRACLSMRSGKRKVDCSNPFQNLSCANISTCYRHSQHLRLQAIAYLILGRTLPLAMLVRILGEKPQKKHFMTADQPS